jgi:hypothetical protein
MGTAKAVTKTVTGALPILKVKAAARWMRLKMERRAFNRAMWKPRALEPVRNESDRP